MAHPIASQGVAAAVTAAVLVSAVLHAAWNTLAKLMPDRLAGFVLIGLTSVACSLLALPWLPPPARSSWSFIAGSAALHVAYELLLIGSYRAGDLSQVYPVARGTSPLLVAAVAGVVAHERLRPVQLAGVVAVCAGLVALAVAGRHRDRRAAGRRPALALALAVATGVSIAAYTVVDGLGVRRSGSPLGYAAWLSLGYGSVLPLGVLAVRGRRLGAALRAGWRAGVAGGVLSLAAYALVLWAQTRGALAAVAALRETSVVVAALLGTWLLGERFGRARVLAAATVAAGIVLLNFH
jgi:drug/metabolite transporter (DMT)-like permease